MDPDATGDLDGMFEITVGGLVTSKEVLWDAKSAVLLEVGGEKFDIVALITRLAPRVTERDVSALFPFLVAEVLRVDEADLPLSRSHVEKPRRYGLLCAAASGHAAALVQLLTLPQPRVYLFPRLGCAVSQLFRGGCFAWLQLVFAQQVERHIPNALCCMPQRLVLEAR